MAGLFALVALAFQPSGLDQFLLPKLLLLAAGLPVVIGIALAGRERRSVDRTLAALVAAFMIWSFAVPWASAPNRTLHRIGALEFGLMVGVFLVSALSGPPCGDRWSVRLLAVPGIGLASMAVLQGLGIGPLRLLAGLSSTRPGRWQVLTTQGNPSWTAEVMVLTLPFALVALTLGGRWRRRSVLLIVALFGAGVVVTGSRGGLLGLLAVGLFGWWIGWFEMPRKIRRWVGAAVLLTVVAAGALVGGRMFELRPLTGRLALWSAGLHLLGERPVTGWGLRHVYLILPEGLEPVVAACDPEDLSLTQTLIVDRLDLDVLHVAVERGLPAAVLLVLIGVTAARRFHERWTKDRNPADAASLAAVVVFGLFSLFSSPFHTPTTAVLFWFLVGSAAGRPRSPALQPRPARQWGAVVVGLGLGTLILGLIGLPVLRDNRIALGGHRLLAEGNPVAAAGLLKPVVDRAPWLPGAALDRARALMESGRPAEALAALNDLERWISSERIWATRARALDRLGREAEARRVLESAFAVLPRSPVLLHAWDELEPGRALPPVGRYR